MAETQTENLQLELTDGDSNFDTDKVKRNFEKIDTAIAEQNKNFAEFRGGEKRRKARFRPSGGF